MTKRSVRRQSFTLVEIIAVLLVIAILAAVAAPKFIGMKQTAIDGMGRAGINEAKAGLSVAYAKAYLENNGTQPTDTEVLAASGYGAATRFGDVIVDVEDGTAGDGTIEITAVSVDGDACSTAPNAVEDTWTVPTN